MSEEQFWRCTPRKLNSLLAIHVKLNGGDEEDTKPVKKNQTKYIDEVLPFF